MATDEHTGADSYSVRDSLGLLVCCLFILVVSVVGVLQAVLGLAAYWVLESHIVDIVASGDEDGSSPH